MIISLAVKDTAFNVISKGNSELTLITDAPKLGWGAVLGVSPTNWSFTLEERQLHINVLELKAIHFGLQNLCGNIRDTHMKFLTDKIWGWAIIWGEVQKGN